MAIYAPWADFLEESDAVDRRARVAALCDYELIQAHRALTSDLFEVSDYWVAEIKAEIERRGLDSSPLH